MKILLATDGTTNSKTAAKALQQFRLGEGDSIHVISVVDVGLPIEVDLYGGAAPHLAEIDRAGADSTNQIVGEAIELLKMEFGDAGVAIDGEVLHGSPESQIVEAARTTESDLIVLGSHASNRLERLLLGSVSDSVVHHAPCSVLVIR